MKLFLRLPAVLAKKNKYRNIFILYRVRLWMVVKGKKERIIEMLDT